MLGLSSRRKLTRADRCQHCSEAAAVTVISGRPQEERLLCVVCLGRLADAANAPDDGGEASSLRPTEFPAMEATNGAHCAGARCAADPIVILTYFGWEGRVRSGSSFLCPRCLQLRARAMLAAPGR